MKTKMFTLFFALAASVGTMFAEKVQIGDLYYNLNANGKTAEVTSESWRDNYRGLTTANIPASVSYSGTTYSVTSIGKEAFRFCSSLTSVTIPNSVTSIGNEAFAWCSSLTSVMIPNSVTSIGSGAFSDCRSLTSINVANDNPNYSSKDGVLFNKQQKTLIQCPIGKQGTYVIPNSVTSIGNGAFAGCSGLTSVTIPNSVTSIGDDTFARCSSLTSMVNYATIPQKLMDNYCHFLDVNLSKCKLYVPAESVNAYKTADVWAEFGQILPICAQTVDVTTTTVNTTATTADVEWPAVENAATYELVIKDKDGNVVCTLIFNANGQLTQIAFGAPARDKAAQAAGFAFTVTGLEEGTSYDLTITAKDGNGTTLDEKTIAFTTTSETGVNALQADELRSSKILRNGEVLILRDGKTYTIQGVEVR